MEDEDDAIIEVPRRTKLGVAAVVALLHVVAVLALIRAFAPDFTAKAVETVVATFSVTVTAPPPSKPAREIEKTGAAGDPGTKAVPREVKAAKPKIAVAKVPAPRASSSGDADTSGARDTGTGTGANGPGGGPGAGSGGDGSGGGRIQPVTKIAGDINSARDYPAASRELRLGSEVIVVMTVGTDGRARNCRVRKPSPDPQAGVITCRLAIERFRFKPATNSAGEPIEASYGWRQKFFIPTGAS